MKQYLFILFIGLFTTTMGAPLSFAAETKAPATTDPKEESAPPKEAATSEKPTEKSESKAAPQTEPKSETKTKDNPAEPAKVLLLDPKILNLDEKTAKLITSFITAELSQYETLDIISGEDMRRMMELEAEKQSIGCTDDNNCLAELAGALGADLVVYGELGKLGNQYMLQQSLFDTKKGKAIARISVQSESVGVIPGQLRAKLRYLVKDFLPKDGSEGSNAIAVQPTAPAAPTPPKAKPIPLVSWVLYSSGALSLAAGGTLTYLGNQSYQAYQTSKTELDGIRTDANTGVNQKAVALLNKNEREADWNSTGQAFLYSGISALTLGVAAVAAGFYFYQEADSE